MKYAFILLALISFQSFAFDVCSYQETADVSDALVARDISSYKLSKNHKKFSYSEKKMIHLTVASGGFLQGVSLDEALEIFGDYQNGKLGPNAGQVKYYKVEGKTLALVHFWPGDNEYGAYYSVKYDGSFRMLALIQDSWIECKK